MSEADDDTAPKYSTDFDRLIVEITDEELHGFFHELDRRMLVLALRTADYSAWIRIFRNLKRRTAEEILCEVQLSRATRAESTVAKTQLSKIIQRLFKKS